MSYKKLDSNIFYHVTFKLYFAWNNINVQDLIFRAPTKNMKCIQSMTHVNIFLIINTEYISR